MGIYDEDGVEDSEEMVGRAGYNFSGRGSGATVDDSEKGDATETEGY